MALRGGVCKGEQSIQPHILYSRAKTRELVALLLSSGVHPNERRKPFTYAMQDGQVYVNLDVPLIRGEMAVFQVPVSAAILAQRQALSDPLQAKLDAAREAYKQAKGKQAKDAAKLVRDDIAAQSYYPERLHEATQQQIAEYIRKSRNQTSAWSKAYTAEGRLKPRKSIEEVVEAMEDSESDEKRAVGRIQLLTLTSKMGCYSFNLPAGPLSHGFYGSCPGSRFGFPMLTEHERGRHGQTEAMSKVQVDQQSWLCAGCYGLKGLYGSPNLVFGMDVRKQFIEGQLAIDKREGAEGLVDIFVKSIRMGQVKSITERYMLHQMGLHDDLWAIPDPAYFRWHDVGDAWDGDYLRTIVRIAEVLSEPFVEPMLRMTLPAVNFWMPTRMWMVKGPMMDLAAKGRIPANLTIRPSAAHFNDRPPVIKGMAAGSGAVCISADVTVQDRAAVEAATGTKLYQNGGKAWICPAYLKPEFKEGRRVGGGGASVLVKRLASGKVSETLLGGACGRAYGPDGQQPAPQGSGCRVCWDRPDLVVIYPEH